MARELEIFANQTEVNDLPPIFHYWSNKYLRPMLEQFGFSNPDQFFAHFLERCCRENTGHPIQIVSVGAGNCDTEVRVARLLLERGINDFTLTCLDLNEDMLGLAGCRRKQHSGNKLWLTFHASPRRSFPLSSGKPRRIAKVLPGFNFGESLFSKPRQSHPMFTWKASFGN